MGLNKTLVQETKQWFHLYFVPGMSTRIDSSILRLLACIIIQNHFAVQREPSQWVLWFAAAATIQESVEWLYTKIPKGEPTGGKFHFASNQEWIQPWHKQHLKQSTKKQTFSDPSACTYEKEEWIRLAQPVCQKRLSVQWASIVWARSSNLYHNCIQE